MRQKVRAATCRMGRSVCAALAIFTAVSGVSEAGYAQSEPITATYRWVTMIEQSDGTYTGTFNFTFINNSADGFNDLRVHLTDSQPFSSMLRASELAVGPLPAGGTTNGSWDVPFTFPAVELEALTFIASGREADGTGERLPIEIRLEGGAQ